MNRNDTKLQSIENIGALQFEKFFYFRSDIYIYLTFF